MFHIIKCKCENGHAWESPIANYWVSTKDACPECEANMASYCSGGIIPLAELQSRLLSQQQIEDSRIKFDQVMEVFDKLRKDYCDCRIDSSEGPLFFLLREHRDKMPPLETQEDYEDFQKRFRQTDVVNENIDIAIYHLLSHSQMFWCACEEVFNDKDADDLFF